MQNNRICIVIPCFNHERFLDTMLDNVTPYKLDCYVIDDGSHTEAKIKIEKSISEREKVYLIRREQNGGKGAAMKEAFKFAQEKNYTHILQIDADCQHSVKDIPLFIQAAKENPDSLILGNAILDQSVPKVRVIGKFINHCCILLETLSLSQVDTMCGFRIYPVSMLSKINTEPIGCRMDFDIEIVVKSLWSGIKTKNIKTKVCYPLGGISNYNYFKENLRISFMHVKLILGMIIRSPLILYRKWKY